jgi:hypothetical protein
MVAQETQLNETVRAWFDDFMAQLAADQLQLETNTATPEKEAFYKQMASGNADETNQMSRAQSSMYFIKNLIIAYIKELHARKRMPAKLAMDLSDAKVLVWAEIKDDDEATEDAMRLAEAKINAQFMNYGFHLSSTIVEESDFLSVPSHYQVIF